MIEGQSKIDQSLITGETLPVKAGPGTAVYAGTLNLSGALRVRVSAASEGTLLAEISRLLDNAVQARSRYVQLADRASRLYAPGGACGGAADHAGLGRRSARPGTMPSSPRSRFSSSPVPVRSGWRSRRCRPSPRARMFRTGVLLNSGDAIERLAEVDRVVFDKTGTLTLPELDVTNAADIPPDVFELAGRLALASHHPVAAAVARAAGAKTPLPGIEEMPGRACAALSTGSKSGSAGRRSAARIRLANEILCRDPEASVVAFRHGEDAACLCGAAAAARRCGRRRCRAAARPGSQSRFSPAIASLRYATPPRSLGIHEWRAGVTPADKIARIEELKRQGVKVMMVGDGMNDAPALAAAHVSMSPVSATHLSQATADLVFLGDRLAPVVAAIGFSRKALRLMRQNLWLAVGLQFACRAARDCGLATPLVAAAAMSGSSLLVILNALARASRRAGSSADGSSGISGSAGAGARRSSA